MDEKGEGHEAKAKKEITTNKRKTDEQFHVKSATFIRLEDQFRHFAEATDNKAVEAEKKLNLMSISQQAGNGPSRRHF